MKKDLHPTDYRPVVFQDEEVGFSFLTRSTVSTRDKIKWEDGKEYPLVRLHVSSASHPFYTGEQRVMDMEGRVDKFNKRKEAAKARTSNLANKAKKVAKKTERKATKSDAK